MHAHAPAGLETTPEQGRQAVDRQPESDGERPHTRAPVSRGVSRAVLRLPVQLLLLPNPGRPCQQLVAGGGSRPGRRGVVPPGGGCMTCVSTIMQLTAAPVRLGTVNG